MNVYKSGLASGTSGAEQTSLENFELKETVNEIANKGKRTYPGGRTYLEYVALAKDPAHGGKVSYQTRKERSIVLNLEKIGKLGHVIRDPQANNGADFIDTKTGISWDVKSPVNRPAGHTSIRKGAFDAKVMMRKINKEIANNHNVILDTRRITKFQISELQKAINESGISDRIIWYTREVKRKCVKTT
ncbi:MAG: hypothetical protein SO119_07665 [Phascolarctobacterium sp.]|nr:hypothetical protein [Phascolarctobacterium sp.]